MQAVVKTQKGYGFTEVCDVPEPQPGPGQVKAEIKYCGICGTDYKMYADEHGYYRPPMILGHEYSAVVVETGEGVTRVAVGDEIVAAPMAPSRPLHQRHAYDYPAGRRRGFESPWGLASYGGMAKFGVFNEAAVIKLPEGVDLESAAMTEPTAVSARGIIHFGMIHCTDVVVVSGPGPIGLLATQIAKAEGGYVIVCGIEGDDRKLEVATEVGADMVFNVSRDDPLPAILDMTYGAGADVVIDGAGHGSSISRLINYARLGAQFIQLGTSKHEYPIDFTQLAYKEIKLVGSFGSSFSEWEKSLRMMAAGKVRPKPLVSHKLPLSQFQHAFDLMEKGAAIKILLYPD